MSLLFDQYTSKFNELRDLEQDELPRSLRLFNIRLRLAADIQINFKGEISLTKATDVRETYALIIQLMEAWNAYEAFSHYASEVSTHVAKKVSKAKIYTQTFLTTVGSMQTLENALDWIKSEYSNSSRFKKDITQYISRIEQDSQLSEKLKEDAKSVLKHLSGEKTISGIELLSLIYAERNMYYHNGETAKMGMAYSNRKKLITKYREILFEHMLKLAIHIVDEQIDETK